MEAQEGRSQATAIGIVAVVALTILMFALPTNSAPITATSLTVEAAEVT